LGTRELTIVAALLLPAVASGQTLTGIKVEPAQIAAGESVRITVSFDVEVGINCGLRLRFGDGRTADYKISQQKDIPLTVARTYSAAGDYEIAAEPRTVAPALKCNGNVQSVTLKVAATGAGPAPAGKGDKRAGSAKPDPHCPDGWALMRRSVKKSGAYTCRAEPGTRAVKLECPAELNYFENRKKGWIGCRP
jgi:hypothetical protein